MSTASLADQDRFWELDFEQILDDYGLLIPPLPEKDPTERRWCVAPYCRNDASERTFTCRGHRIMQLRAGWSTAELIARELARAARPGAGCANPACPTPATTEPSQKTLMSDRARQFAPRRFHAFEGEYLCRVCAGILTPVSDVFEPSIAPPELVVVRARKAAIANIPQATYEKLTGQALLRSQRGMRPQHLTVADGYTLDQWVLGLEQYAGFWASVKEERYVLRVRPDDAPEWIASLNQAAEDAVEAMIAAGEIPDYSIPYQPHPIVVDAMLQRFPKGNR